MKPVSIRTNSLTLAGPGPKTIERMEAHGKREDRFAKARVVRSVDPLVYGSMDLRDAYHAHMDGVKVSAGLKRPALHSIIKFPGDLEVTEEHQQLMLEAAVKFVNLTHGGNAVFAARLDRDEAGEHNVDVFYAPKFEKTTTARKSDPDAGIRRGDKITTTWMSTTKHGKELCEKHRDEIRSRNDKGVFSTTPRSVGIALQSELFAFLRAEGLDVAPRTPKSGLTPDWQEVDAWKRTQDEKAKAAKIAEDARKSSDDAERIAADLIANAEVRAMAIMDEAHADADRQRELARSDAFAEAAEEISALRAGLVRVQTAVEKIASMVRRLLPAQADKIVGKLDAVSAEADFITGQIDAVSAPKDPVEDRPGFG